MIPTEWLRQRIAMPGEDAPEDALPFAELDSWSQGFVEEVRLRRRPGDQVWSFASDGKSWTHLAGRQGYALVRDGKVVDTAVTMMN